MDTTEEGYSRLPRFDYTDIFNIRPFSCCQTQLYAWIFSGIVDNFNNYKNKIGLLEYQFAKVSFTPQLFHRALQPLRGIAQ